MNRVLALVEGQTEQTFVRDVLAPELALRGVYLTARLIGKPGHKGGMRSYAAARHEILKLLQEDARRYCTTMFDYYRLPTDWPGRLRSTQLGVPDCALALEDATHGDICQKLGEPFDPRRFIPHVQLHEFEAMLFVAPAVVAKAAQAEHVAPRLQRILDEFRHPEAINDGPETSPSKRLISLIPGYDKVSHGSIAAKEIGLAAIRAQCAHFSQWVRRLENLCGQSAASSA